MIDAQRPVRVFRNWKRGCYSIMQDGRIHASASQVRLGDVQFVVRESGRQRMLREQSRNVHAYAVGVLVDYVHPDEDRRLAGLGGRAVHYDPRRCAAFVDSQTLAPVTVAESALLDEGGVTYCPQILPAAA